MLQLRDALLHCWFVQVVTSQISFGSLFYTENVQLSVVMTELCETLCCEPRPENWSKCGGKTKRKAGAEADAPIINQELWRISHRPWLICSPFLKTEGCHAAYQKTKYNMKEIFKLQDIQWAYLHLGQSWVQLDKKKTLQIHIARNNCWLLLFFYIGYFFS